MIIKVFVKRDFKKIVSTNTIIISLILAIIYSIINVPINDTNIINYETTVIKDLIENKTNVEYCTDYKVYLEEIRRGYGKGKGNPMPFYTAHLSYYIEGNDSRFVSGIPDSVALIIKNNLKYWEKSIEIEYYNNSKVIKAIDGIEISDKDIIEKLGNRVRELSKKNKKDKEDSIIYNSIGKNIKEVKKELEENGINDVNIYCINSRYYPIGKVAFVSKYGDDFSLREIRVVEGDETEDLTKMPQLKVGMSKDEIKQKLKECNLDYRFTIIRNDSIEKGLFLYTPPGEGVYVPKGSIVNVTINE